MKKLLLTLLVAVMSVTAWAVEDIATATFNGRNETYTSGWTTTGTGKGRTDCIIIGMGENITSPAFDFSVYSSVSIEIKARRYGTLTGSKATIDASISGSSVGTTAATGTNASNVAGTITFTPTASMTSAVLVFTCTNATSAGSTHGAGIGTITITGKPATSDPYFNEIATVVLECDATSGEFSYVINNPNSSTLQAAKITNATWLSNVTVDEANNKVTFDTEANEGNAREATIRLTYGTLTKDVTVSQKKFVKDYADLPLKVAAGLSSAELKTTNGVSGVFDGSDYSNATHKIKFSKNTHYMVVKTNAQIGTCIFSVKGCAGAGNSPITVQESTDGENYTDVQSFIIAFSAKDQVKEVIVTKAFNAASRYIKFKSDKATGDVNFGLGKFTINAYEVAEVVPISAAGWATYVAPCNLDFTDNAIEAYAVSAVSATSVTLSPLTTVPAGEAIIVKGETGNVPVAASAAPINNELAAATAPVTATGSEYVLAKQEGQVVFAPVAEGVVIPEGKAYLKNLSGAASLRIDIEGMEDGMQTAISLTPSLSEGEGACYDLYGRRANGKGLMIQNGKVVLVK